MCTECKKPALAQKGRRECTIEKMQDKSNGHKVLYRFFLLIKVTSHLARPTLLNFALLGKYARYLSETCHVPWLINEEYTSMIKIKVV